MYWLVGIMNREELSKVVKNLEATVQAISKIETNDNSDYANICRILGSK